MYREGIYEKVITKELKEYLDGLNQEIVTDIRSLEQAESDIVLSRHLGEVLKLALKQIEEERGLGEGEKLKKQVELVNSLIEQIKVDRGNGFGEEFVWEEAKMLYGINNKREDVRPTTPLSQTTLFTNAHNEPNLYHELRLEILSSNRIDLLVSFIKWSGLRCLKDALEEEKYRGSQEIVVKSSLTPNYFQKEMLDKLKIEREVHGHHKNLVVAATGVGKTVISAFDYRRLRRENLAYRGRLLFVAHKQEILKQSLHTFRRVLMDWNFGELYFNGRIPDQLDYLFMTIQTFNSQKLTEKLPENYYDMIIVDEFHHAAASSYQRLLGHFKPKILLGLTATPERMDGKNVLDYFDGRIAAELRLGEAIDERLLSPFHYFCITDCIDYSKLDWTRGGYDEVQLDHLISADTQRANLVLKSLYTYLTDIHQTRGIGFCVSIKHATFMSEYFRNAGIPSAMLCGTHSEKEREEVIASFIRGEIKFIFTVDLFNEGVDIPSINTVLFLRPTESLTVWVQQLGRGLRLDEGKECLTVLDYVGQAHKKYNYYNKLAILSKLRGKSLKESITRNNFLLPKGCYLYMEKVAREYILNNIDGYICDKRGIISRIKEFAETHQVLDVGTFINTYELSFTELYKIKLNVRGKSMPASFYRLCVEAGVREEESHEEELKLSGALGRVSMLTSREILKFLIGVLNDVPERRFGTWSEVEVKWLLMFHYTLWGDALKTCGMKTLEESLYRLYKVKPLYEEVKSILTYRYMYLDTVTQRDISMVNSPLELHGTYTMDQILVALGKHTKEKKYHFQEGVLYVKEKNLDAFFITLNKVEKHYSPSTMYKDYAISPRLFHWQTQSRITPESPTCQRYINHKKMNHTILLFVREHKHDNGLTAAFTYLGQGNYIEHYGSKPVNIIWELEDALPPYIEIKAQKAL